MDLLSGIGTLMLVINLVAVAVGVFDIVDAAIRPAEAFVAAGKLTKPMWLIIVGLSTVAVWFFGLISFLGIPAVVAILVYLVDVRPAVRAVTGGRPPSTSW